MADIQLATQSAPSTPASGNAILYVDSTSKELVVTNDAGVSRMCRPLANGSTADQSIAANTNTFITGSSIAMPSTLIRAGTQFHWVFSFSKTAGQTGTATPIWTVTFGTAGTIADTARLTFTGVAMTASVADTATVNIDVVCRAIGASAGVLSGVYWMNHIGATAAQNTGFAGQPTDVKQTTSSTFDTTVASSIIGVGVNFGASTAATMLVVSGWSFNL